MISARILYPIFTALAFCAQPPAYSALPPDEALKNYENFLREKTSETERLSAEISALRKTLAMERQKLENAKETRVDASALAAENDFLDSKNTEILKALEAFENVATGRTPDKYAMSLPETCAAVRKRVSRAFDTLLHPLEPLEIQMEMLSENGGTKRLTGKFARLADTGYFLSDNNADAFMFDSLDAKLVSKTFGAEKSEAIKAFILGKSKTLPLKNRETKKSANLADMSISEEIAAGGIWMVPILLFGLLSFGAATVKSLGVLGLKRAPEDVVENIAEKLSEGDENAALNCAKSAGRPYAGMLEALVKLRKKGASAIEESSYEFMLLEGERLYYGLGLISITATIAPLLGLLGTVTGIIKTFGNLSANGAGDAALMSQGIGEALITTEFGLVVAIPSYVMHALLSRKAKAVLSDMEKLASGFLNISK